MSHLLASTLPLRPTCPLGVDPTGRRFPSILKLSRWAEKRTVQKSLSHRFKSQQFYACLFCSTQVRCAADKAQAKHAVCRTFNCGCTKGRVRPMTSAMPRVMATESHRLFTATTLGDVEKTSASQCKSQQYVYWLFRSGNQSPGYQLCSIHLNLYFR